MGCVLAVCRRAGGCCCASWLLPAVSGPRVGFGLGPGVLVGSGPGPGLVPAACWRWGGAGLPPFLSVWGLLFPVLVVLAYSQGLKVFISFCMSFLFVGFRPSISYFLMSETGIVFCSFKK